MSNNERNPPESYYISAIFKHQYISGINKDLNPMVKEKELKQWLASNKGFSPRSAGDVVSRCRRVERVLDIDLASELKKPAGLNLIYNRLQEEQSQYLKPGGKAIYSVAVLKRAVTLYSEYLNLE